MRLSGTSVLRHLGENTDRETGGGTQKVSFREAPQESRSKFFFGGGDNKIKRNVIGIMT